jgi:hypothetical protein
MMREGAVLVLVAVLLSLLVGWCLGNAFLWSLGG